MSNQDELTLPADVMAQAQEAIVVEPETEVKVAIYVGTFEPYSKCDTGTVIVPDSGLNVLAVPHKRAMGAIDVEVFIPLITPKDVAVSLLRKIARWIEMDGVHDRHIALFWNGAEHMGEEDDARYDSL